VYDTIEPIKTAIDDAVSAILPDDLEALLNELGDTVANRSSRLSTAELHAPPGVQAGIPLNAPCSDSGLCRVRPGCEGARSAALRWCCSTH
jgi:hypothetical protein